MSEKLKVLIINGHQTPLGYKKPKKAKKGGAE